MSETTNKLAVIITTPPYNNLSVTALNYIETALRCGINIIGVFFYQDGVLHASAKLDIASDEFQASQHWKKLNETYNLPLHLCITASQIRGMNVEQADNILPVFTISGLGELVELTTKANRVVQF